MKKMIMVVIFTLALCVYGCNEQSGGDDEHSHEYVEGVCSCGELEENRLFVEYDKEVLYTNYGMLKVTSTYKDDEIKIVSRNIGVCKIDKKQENNKILYGVRPGSAVIVISNKYDEVIELEIEVLTSDEFSPILGFNVKLLEDGPYHVGETYHVSVMPNPSNFVDDEYGFIKNSLYDFNKETMEIVFHHTGSFDFQVYSSVMNITEKYEVEIVPMEGVAEYNVLYVGNSLTYVHDIPAIVKSMVEADGSRFFYVQQTVGGAYLKDHKDNFYKNMDLYTFSDVILQGQSFEAVGDYNTFEKYMIEYAERVHETSARVHVYQTWGYERPKWAANVNGEVVMMDKYTMYDLLQSAYDQVASKIQANVIRSGEAFEVYGKEYDLPSLYQDMNHQSLYGAYLSACCHYAEITGNSPINNSFVMEGIEHEIQVIIREIADSVCFK